MSATSRKKAHQHKTLSARDTTAGNVEALLRGLLKKKGDELGEHTLPCLSRRAKNQIIGPTCAVHDALFNNFLLPPNRYARSAQSPQMVLDPTMKEENSGAGVMTVALMPGSQQVTQWWQEGRFEGQKVAEALELCTDGCGCVHKMMEAKLKASSAKR